MNKRTMKDLLNKYAHACVQREAKAQESVLSELFTEDSLVADGNTSWCPKRYFRSFVAGRESLAVALVVSRTNGRYVTATWRLFFTHSRSRQNLREEVVVKISSAGNRFGNMQVVQRSALKPA